MGAGLSGRQTTVLQITQSSLEREWQLPVPYGVGATSQQGISSPEPRRTRQPWSPLRFQGRGRRPPFVDGDRPGR